MDFIVDPDSGALINIKKSRAAEINKLDALDNRVETLERKLNIFNENLENISQKLDELLKILGK
jgi:chaperonin cofactor prefoldin